MAEIAREQAKEQGSLFFHNPDDCSFVPSERASRLSLDPGGRWRFVQPPGRELTAGDKLAVQRQADALNDLAVAGLRLPFIVNMHDAIRKENTFPVFQYNRLFGARNSILLPLDRVHRIGAKSFCSLPNPAEKTFREKKTGLSWRGAVRGFILVNGRPINIRTIVTRFQNGQLDRETFLTNLEALPRYKFVSRYFNQKNFDIGFSNRSQDLRGWNELPDIARYQKPISDPAAQAEYKYLLSIQGTDVGSSFGWQLSTNSVILREMYPWEVFFDCHFHPWEHYVPIKPDFSDVLEKIDWCEGHPEECQRMIDLRHDLVRLLVDESAREEALRRVATRYTDFYLRGNYISQPAGG